MDCAAFSRLPDAKGDSGMNAGVSFGKTDEDASGTAGGGASPHNAGIRL
jgi:hypothetical protein